MKKLFELKDGEFLDGPPSVTQRKEPEKAVEKKPSKDKK